MTHRRIAFLAGVTLVVAATGVFGLVVGEDEPRSVLALMGVWAVLGSVIVALRPSNAVGWLFLVTGLWLAIGLATTSAVDHLGTGPLLTFLSWWSEWFWILGFGLMIT